LFAYDNNTFVVQSFLPTETTVTVNLAGNAGAVTDLVTNQSVARFSGGAGGRARTGRASDAGAGGGVVYDYGAGAFVSGVCGGELSTKARSTRRRHEGIELQGQRRGGRTETRKENLKFQI